MSEPSVDDMLSRYASRKTTPAEEQALLRAAAEDQDIFEALAHEEVLREIMDDTAARKELLKATAPEPAWKAAITSLIQPRTIWSLAGATAAAAIALTVIVPRSADKGIKEGPEAANLHLLSAQDVLPDSARTQFDSFTAVTRPNDNAVRIEVPKKNYRVGDGLRIRFQSDIEAKLTLVGESQDGRSRVLFPNHWHPSPDVPAGVAQTVPPARYDPVVIDGSPGRLHLILAAFPADSDPEGALQRGERLPTPLAVATADLDVNPR